MERLSETRTSQGGFRYRKVQLVAGNFEGKSHSQRLEKSSRTLKLRSSPLAACYFQ